jgi:hypothetical protein
VTGIVSNGHSWGAFIRQCSFFLLIKRYITYVVYQGNDDIALGGIFVSLAPKSSRTPDASTVSFRVGGVVNLSTVYSIISRRVRYQYRAYFLLFFVVLCSRLIGHLFSVPRACTPYWEL